VDAEAMTEGKEAKENSTFVSTFFLFGFIFPRLSGPLRTGGK